MAGVKDSVGCCVCRVGCVFRERLLRHTLAAMLWNDVASYVGFCVCVRDYIAHNWQWIGSRICSTYAW